MFAAVLDDEVYYAKKLVNLEFKLRIFGIMFMGLV